MSATRVSIETTKPCLPACIDVMNQAQCTIGAPAAICNASCLSRFGVCIEDLCVFAKYACSSCIPTSSTCVKDEACLSDNVMDAHLGSGPLAAH